MVETLIVYPLLVAWDIMAGRKARFHMPGVAGIVRFPEETATIEHNLEWLHVGQQGDPGLDVSELEDIDHADEYRTINDLIFSVPTPTWWERHEDVEIEDIWVEGHMFRDVEILKVTVRQGTINQEGGLFTPTEIWREMVHDADPNLGDTRFRNVWNVPNRVVRGGVAVILTIRFNREQEPFSAIRINSVGAQFDPTRPD